MATTALPAGEHYDQSNQLTRFDHFIAAQHDAAIPLPAFEFAKLDALRDDVAWLQDRDARGEAERAPWLGALYAGFERGWGRPGDTRHGYAGASPCRRRVRRPGRSTPNARCSIACRSGTAGNIAA
jgi:hypothetical protein